jgi:hypothetical protein
MISSWWARRPLSFFGCLHILRWRAVKMSFERLHILTIIILASVVYNIRAIPWVYGEFCILRAVV